MSRKLKIQLKIRRPVLWISVLGIGVLLIASKFLYDYLQQSTPLIDKRLQVQTIRVKQSPMPKVIDTIGGLTAKKELTLKAGSSGRMQEYLVDAGSWVKEGTLLAHIIAAPEVRAPFSGYLTDWLVKPGEYVTAGTALIDLVDTEWLELTYRVPEHYASELALEQPIEMSVRAVPNEIFKGTVRFIAPIVDKKSHTILVRAEVANPKQNLWPGMSARVRHILVLYPDALVIPEGCLQLTLEGYQVFVIEKDKVVRRPVTIGERQGGRVHILSGLKLGEAVVLTRTYRIQEGTDAVAVDWTGDW